MCVFRGRGWMADRRGGVRIVEWDEEEEEGDVLVVVIWDSRLECSW
jgi:hypothetical protein